MTSTMVALFTDRRSRAVFDEEIRIREEIRELVAQPTNPQSRLAFRYGDSEDEPFESQLETRTIGLLNRETGGLGGSSAEHLRYTEHLELYIISPRGTDLSFFY
jgi:hypothetical protein